LKISVNGETRDVAPGTTLASLVAGLKLGGLKVAVERNFNIVARQEYDATVLVEGDRLEVVTFVGGG
jgi:sulfur carrier protein